MAPVHFFLVLAQKGEREGTESEKVEKENPWEAKHWVHPSCHGLENPKAPPISLIQSNLFNWVAFSLIRCLVICYAWMSRAQVKDINIKGLIGKQVHTVHICNLLSHMSCGTSGWNSKKTQQKWGEILTEALFV